MAAKKIVVVVDLNGRYIKFRNAVKYRPDPRDDKVYDLIDSDGNIFGSVRSENIAAIFLDGVINGRTSEFCGNDASREAKGEQESEAS